MTRKLEDMPAISQGIWELKYRYTPAGGGDGALPPSAANRDETAADTFRRVANAAASVEAKGEKRRWAARFLDIMAGFEFLPAGRILAGAGTNRTVTLFNCFVMGRIEDGMASIFENLKEAALTMQQGGGIGHDFSTLRPKGAPVRGVGADASGPVSFMTVWDAMCRTIMSAGSRRGAMMGTMSCRHPDIEAFIGAKRDAAALRNFNLSVMVTDDFMAAVKAGGDWDLVFGGKVYKTMPARALWDKIMRAAYETAEPGVIFIDRVNAENSLGYLETISATNPCGEQPLPPHGACLLGSINLARLIRNPFEAQAGLDEKRLEAIVPAAVRLLDNVIDISHFPLPAQAAEARAKRRIGLGVTGLADALIMCGLHYGSAAARETAKRWMARIETLAYLASAGLAAEKGAFPLFDREAHLKTGHAAKLSAEIRGAIEAHGLRNGLLTSIAPAGTISLFAGNVSSGIEPAFGFVYRRRILEPDGSVREETVEDYAYRAFRMKYGAGDAKASPVFSSKEAPFGAGDAIASPLLNSDAGAALPDYFVTAHTLTPDQHLAMQAALQPHVDASISKTVNCPAGIPFEDFTSIYRDAYAKGLKGCTVYRPNPVTGAVLSSLDGGQPAAKAVIPADAGLPAGIPNETLRPEPPLPHPLQREEVLAGYTYKLRWPESDHAIYVTINDIIDEGRRRPFEIFINSKNLEHYAWTVALTRMISAVFRRGGDVGFVVEELKAVFDPRGGHWLGGRYVPSLLAAIGSIIEKHMIETGFLNAPLALAPVAPPQPLEAAGPPPGSNGQTCPRCGVRALAYQEGCHFCRSCGYSTCG